MKESDFIDFTYVLSSCLTYLKLLFIQQSVTSSLYWPIFVTILKSTAENINHKHGETYKILLDADDLGRRQSGQRMLTGTSHKFRAFFFFAAFRNIKIQCILLCSYH